MHDLQAIIRIWDSVLIMMGDHEREVEKGQDLSHKFREIPLAANREWPVGERGDSRATG